MINIDTKSFEKLISEFIEARDIRSLVDKFSKDRMFYYYILRDISKGRESLNYKILQKVAQKKKVSENFVIEQAKSVLSYIAPYNEPDLDDYYEILKVPPNASDKKIRQQWLELMKSHQIGKDTQGGSDSEKKITEAYEVLGTPQKRGHYDAKHHPYVPIIVKDDVKSGGGRVLLYFVPFIFILAVSYLYITSSGLILRTNADKGEFARQIETPSLPEIDTDSGKYDRDIKTDSLLAGSQENAQEQKEENIETANNNEEIQTVAKLALDEETKESEDHRGKVETTELLDVEPLPQEDGSPQFVKIIPDEFENSEGAHKETIITEKTILKDPVRETSTYKSKLATPAVAVNDSAVRLQELDPNMPAPDYDSLYLFVSQYINAYKNRDLQTIRSLFAPNARENGESIYNVLDVYKHNFSTLEILRYDVKIQETKIDNVAGVVLGDFIVSFRSSKDRQVKSSRGNITWLLKWRGHKWEIEEILYRINDTNVIDG